MKIYVSGRISDDPEHRDINIAVADQAARDLIVLGHVPYCPHTMTRDWLAKDHRLTRDKVLKVDFTWLEECEAILMLPTAPWSEGAKLELTRAKERGIPVYYSILDLPEEEHNGDSTREHSTSKRSL